MEEGKLRQLWQKSLKGVDFTKGAPGSSYRPPPRERLSLNTTKFSSAKLLSKKASVPFQLMEEIGRGGMGVVFRARQTSLERTIAVKTLLEDADDDEVKSFIAEAMVTGYLDHPNIVPVHSLEKEKDRWLIGMKLVDGMSWRQLLHPQTKDEKERSSKLEWLDHINILKDVCNAVAFAHKKGILHLDLKPENVMVGEFGEVLVMDWGLAVGILHKKDTIHDLPLPHKSTVTTPRGTPFYIAPELAAGKGRALGPWTDVYLLGGILYEILSGLPPHKGKSLIQVLMSAVERDPPELPSKIPGELRDICTTALAKETNKRFQSVTAFQDALDDYLKRRESRTIAYRARRLLRQCHRAVKQQYLEGREAFSDEERNRVYADYADAVAGFRQARILWSKNELAERGEEEARRSYARAAMENGDLGLAEAQVSRMDESWSETKVLSRDIGREKKNRERTKKLAQILWASLGMVLCVMIVGMGVALVMVNKAHSRAEQERQEADLARRVAEEDRVAADVARKKALEASKAAITEKLATERARARAVEAGDKLALAVERQSRERTRAEKNAELAASRASLAKDVIDQLLTRIDAGFKNTGASYQSQQLKASLLEAALEGLEKLRDTDVAEAKVSKESMQAYLQVGSVYSSLGKVKECEQSFQEAARIGRSLIAVQPENAELHGLFVQAASQLGRIKTQQGQFDEAKKIFEEGLRAVEVANKVLAGNATIQASLAQMSTDLGETLYHQRKFSDSRKHFIKGVEILRGLVKGQNPKNARLSLARTLYFLGSIEWISKKLAAALVWYRESLAHFRALARQNRWVLDYQTTVSTSLLRIAQLEKAQGQREQACRTLAELIRHHQTLATTWRRPDLENQVEEYQRLRRQWLSE